MLVVLSSEWVSTLQKISTANNWHLRYGSWVNTYWQKHQETKRHLRTLKLLLSLAWEWGLLSSRYVFFSSLRTKRVLLNELNLFLSLENLTRTRQDDFCYQHYMEKGIDYSERYWFLCLWAWKEEILSHLDTEFSLCETNTLNPSTER